MKILILLLLLLAGCSDNKNQAARNLAPPSSDLIPAVIGNGKMLCPEGFSCFIPDKTSYKTTRYSVLPENVAKENKITIGVMAKGSSGYVLSTNISVDRRGRMFAFPGGIIYTDQGSPPDYIYISRDTNGEYHIFISESHKFEREEMIAPIYSTPISYAEVEEPK